MSFLAYLFILVFAFCAGQQCPRRGEVRKADPRQDHRYLQCNDGRGRWCYCPEGQVFVEEEQCCLTPRRSSSQKSVSKDTGSSGSSSQRRSSSRNSEDRQVNSNARVVGSASEDMDYHW